MSSTCVGIYSTYCFYVTALFSLLITSSANSLSLWQQSSTSSIIRTWNVLSHEMQELKKYLTTFIIMSGHLCKVIYRILRDCRCHSLQYNGIPDWTSTDKLELDGGMWATNTPLNRIGGYPTQDVYKLKLRAGLIAEVIIFIPLLSISISWLPWNWLGNYCWSCDWKMRKWMNFHCFYFHLLHHGELI